MKATHLRHVLPLLVLAAALLAPASIAAQEAPACQLVLGFKTLHDLDAGDVGDCIDNQAFQANGDAIQHTTKGLMVWRKADNWTAFTNGSITWINGPLGLVSRPNTSRFSWEVTPSLAVAPVTALPAATPTPLPPSPTAAADSRYAWYIKKVTDPPVEMCGSIPFSFYVPCVDSAPNEGYQYVGGHVIHKDGTPASGMVVEARVGLDLNSPLLYGTSADDGAYNIVFGIGCSMSPTNVDIFMVDVDMKVSSPMRRINYTDCHKAGEFHVDFVESGTP